MSAIFGNKILVIVAHPDDEILGLGGTIRYLADLKVSISLIILGTGLSSRLETIESLDKKNLEDLRIDSIKSSDIIGYEKVFFEDLPDNRFDSVSLLDVVKIIEKYISEIKPDTILTHFHGDLNIDHQITSKAVITATRPMQSSDIKNVILFETPSSTEWNFLNSNRFNPNIFVDTTLTHKFKLLAMDSYLTERRESPHPRSNSALDAISVKWGSTIGVQYAEAFMLVWSKVE